MSFLGRVFGRGGYLNIWVILGMIVLSVVLGILNNMRVYEEQQVRLWGDTEEEGPEESVDADDDANP